MGFGINVIKLLQPLVRTELDLHLTVLIKESDGHRSDSYFSSEHHDLWTSSCPGSAGAVPPSSQWVSKSPRCEEYSKSLPWCKPLSGTLEERMRKAAVGTIQGVTRVLEVPPKQEGLKI